MINLDKCKPGDKLRVRRSKELIEWEKSNNVKPVSDIVEFVGKNERSNYYEYEIKYSNGSPGTRTVDGYVFIENRLPTDMDVIEIIGE